MKWKIFLHMTKFWAYAMFCWSTAYLITSFFFDVKADQPGDFIRYFVTGLVGLLLVSLVGYLFARFSAPKRFELFHVMMDAFRQIAKGNFKVRLNANLIQDNDSPFGEVFESINHMAEELNRMEQMRQEFVSNVSHEIQSPLTSIRGFANALQKDELSAEARKHYLRIIEQESVRLSKLSENLLKLSSLESDVHPFEPKPYRLDKQLQKVILSLEPQWVKKSIEMDLALEEVTVFADEDMMGQLWVNLISNSIKFTPDGGVIGVELRKKGERAEAILSDTGIGIAEEDQAHIFERFYKADKSRNRSIGGSGLGLAIVKKIIERHHGSIKVKSKLGEGTEMTIHLPLKPRM